MRELSVWISIETRSKLLIELAIPILSWSVAHSGIFTLLWTPQRISQMFNSTCVTHLLHTEAFGFKTKEWEEMGRNRGKETMILGTLLGNQDASRSRRLWILDGNLAT